MGFRFFNKLVVYGVPLLEMDIFLQSCQLINNVTCESDIMKHRNTAFITTVNSAALMVPALNTQHTPKTTFYNL